MNRRLIGIVFTMMMLTLFGQAATAQAAASTVPQPVLVKDINAAKLGSSSNANGYVAVGAITFFSANDGVHGQELWKSDGTEAGTVLVKDINPTGGSFPQYLTNVGGALYFAANDGTNGFELWKSDGTANGTVLVKDINPSGDSYPQNLTNVGGVLYFLVVDPMVGSSLWKSDGTAAGTVVVKDAGPIATGSQEYFFISDLTSVGNDLYFTVGHPVTGYALWKSNATGTVLVSNFGPGSGITDLTDVGGTLFFRGRDWVNYNARDGIWKSDGTTAVQVKNFDSSTPVNLTNVNGVLFFSGYDAVNGRELWKSDGTEAGTVLVKDVNAFPPTIVSSSPENLTNVNGVLYFTAQHAILGTGLWKSDGTANGTVLVKGGGTSNLTSVGSALYFTLRGVNGTELWKSDTTAGAVLVTDFSPASALNVTASNLTNAGGVLYFTVFGVNGEEPWKSDGTAGGTVMLKQIFSGTGPSMEPMMENPAVNVNGVLYFTAISDLVNGLALWKSDGTEAGTTLVKGFGIKISLSNLTNVNGVLYFVNRDSGIWKSDGTEAGTVLVKDFSANSLTPSNLIDVNGVLYFTAYDGVNSTGLWKSDGTDAGTVQVRLFAMGSAPSSLTNVNGVLYFSAGEGAMGTELWKSDGTETGTVQVKDINPGDGNGSNPSNLTDVGDVLYFTATDAVNGTALWKTDGTDVGTVLVKVVTPVGGIPAFFFYSSATVNGVFYFTVFDPASGFSLWKSDATSGAVLVTSFPATSPYGLTNINGTLYYFYDSMTVSGTELWKSDGTAAGTVLVKAVIPGGEMGTRVKQLAKTVAAMAGPGPKGGSSALLVEANGVAYFSAFDATHGTELWKSDGTTDGTAMVTDIYPGTSGSYPTSLINVNGALFFNADDGFHGNELWVLRMNSATVATFGTNHSTYGQPVTITATVTSGATGTVAFSEGSTAYCGAASLDKDGKAACDITNLSAGSHTITATYGGDGHYNGSSATIVQSVGTAGLTVTADSKSRNYGSANPAMTATYAGFVNNDTLASLSGAPDIVTTATTASAAGNYPITISAGTLASGNYSFTFVNGIMAVSLSAAASGDINNDGKVDIADALMALQMMIGLSTPTPTQLTAGDVAPMVNGKPAPDGIIDIADAMLILENAVGILSWQ